MDPTKPRLRLSSWFKPIHTTNQYLSKPLHQPWFKRLLARLAVSRALSSAAATKERVAVTRSQKEMTVSGSGSSGFETDTDDGSEGVLIVGVTAQKLLNDNGKTDRAIYLSELLAETAKLESQIAFDQALQQILDAYIAQKHSLRG